MATENSTTKATKALGERVAALRAAKSLSQEQLAAKTGHHRTYVNRLERGAMDPTLSSVLRIAAALDVNAGDLVSDLQGLIGDPRLAGRKRPEAVRGVRTSGDDPVA